MEMTNDVQVSISRQYSSDSAAVKFGSICEKGGHRLLFSRVYDCEGLDSKAIDDASFYIKPNVSNTHALFVEEEAVGWVWQTTGTAYLEVAANSNEDAQAMLLKLYSYAPEEPEAEDDDIYVRFWAAGKTGPTSHRRKLTEIPSWDDITINYNQITKSNIESFMDEDWRPDKGGQLLLWHGVPGTGKTTALRAMGRQWRNWCDIHYVTDPEMFFSQSDYMMSVITFGSSDRWRLLVFEDTGEFLTVDARMQIANSQGLSRFLNLMDGLPGQGINFLCLVTTNEPIKKMHPAVTRSGRCMSILEFHSLTPEETLNWGLHNGVESDTLVSSMTVADLYAAKTETKVPETKKKVMGFA